MRKIALALSAILTISAGAASSAVITYEETTPETLYRDIDLRDGDIFRFIAAVSPEQPTDTFYVRFPRVLFDCVVDNRQPYPDTICRGFAPGAEILRTKFALLEGSGNDFEINGSPPYYTPDLTEAERASYRVDSTGSEEVRYSIEFSLIPAPVPLPAGIALLPVALLGLGVLGHRRGG